MALTVAARLVEIESSSGSDSSSSSSTESDDGQLEEGPKSPRYQEEVTVHMTYYKHQKSLITHKLLSRASLPAKSRLCGAGPNFEFQISKVLALFSP